MNQKHLDPEKWLELNCKDEDWDNLHEGIKDFISTNNVVRYMERYSEYKRGNPI